jgi:hypothetical protein
MSGIRAALYRPRSHRDLQYVGQMKPAEPMTKSGVRAKKTVMWGAMCADGWGRYRFSDGRVYEGEWLGGRRDGYGEMSGRPEGGKHPDQWAFYAGNTLVLI